MKKYRVTYFNGSGREYNDGTWIVKTTPKTIRAEKIKQFETGVYSMHDVGFKARIGKGTGNPIREDDHDTFIVYFGQAGTPYYFEPISEIKNPIKSIKVESFTKDDEIVATCLP